jgi:hypothetical protein
MEQSILNLRVIQLLDPLSLVKNGNGVMSMKFSLDRDSNTIPSKQKKI